MTQLHAYYHLRNLQAFQRLLNEGAEATRSTNQNALSNGLSSSGGRSWSKPSPLSAATACDVNARDWLGMTVLHHACANTEPVGLHFVRTLLTHPGINVNICDVESHWTPLHRALYNGNISAACLLLRRQDIDISIKDFEGYTAFDLYNSTIAHSKPDSFQPQAELFTWGANRNASLGQGDGNDRTFPDQVVIQPKDTLSADLGLETRFTPINVREVVMARLHTAIVTTEPKGNLRLCGFGSGGRLGPGQQAQQYPLKPLSELNPYTIVSVALGQDHTLALTSTGEILSWGLNRFSQLGYVIDPPSGPDMSGFARKDEPIQASPRKIPGSLKKAFVIGVAACKMASACWTSKEVFTWGTNSGQLGYDRSAQPVQIQPRVVTKLPFPAVDIALSDTAMVCLVKMDNGTRGVYYIHHDICSKLSFPPHAFPAQIYPYRPPQSTANADIQKVTCCEDNFAALTANGEVFMFSFGSSDAGNGGLRSTVKPQRVWALRKQFSAVKDVALGSDGSLVVCTESGHVYVRTRSAQTKASSSARDRGGNSKPFKFQRVPYLQRVVRVCANSTGAFGALKVGFQPRNVILEGNGMERDARSILPGIAPPNKINIDNGGTAGSNTSHIHGARKRQLSVGSDTLGDGDGEDDLAIINDQVELNRLCEFIEASTLSPLTPEIPKHPSSLLSTFTNHGADIWAQVISAGKSSISPLGIPVHRVILVARSPPLLNLLSTSGMLQGDGVSVRYDTTSSNSGRNILRFEGCLPLSFLILLVYLYSDQVVALWDTRVRLSLPMRFSHFASQSTRVKVDLQKLSKLLDLPHLAKALESPAKRAAEPSLCRDLTSLYSSAQTPSGWDSAQSSPLKPNVLLRLKDRHVLTHSSILRARSLFFASMFDEEDWTVKRWDRNGMIEVQMEHLEWRSMQYVLRFLCCGEDEEMFHVLNTIQTSDQLLDLLFQVMAAANELLLDRLVLICSAKILKFINIDNACYVLSDATFFHSLPLMSRVQDFMTVNMETMLEGRLLDDLASDLVDQLSRFVQSKQAEKLPISRSGILVVDALFKHKDWLDQQDIAMPIVVKNPQTIARKASVKLSPPPNTKPMPMSRVTAPAAHQPSALRAQSDDIFAMDEHDEPAPAVTQPPPVWKAASVPRVDMKTLMAEQERSASKLPTTPVRQLVALPGSSTSSPRAEPQTPQRNLRTTPASSPWGAAGSRVPVEPVKSEPPTFPALGAQPVPSAQVSRPKPPRPTPLPSSSAPTQPSMGPVYAPSRQSQPPGPTPRRISSSKAWTSPPAQPATPVAQGSGISLVAIQQLELEQSRPQTKDKRSIVDIQREEQDRQAEEDFLRWWASEEQRVKLESELPSHSQPKQRRGGANKAKQRSSKKTTPKRSSDAQPGPPN